MKIQLIAEAHRPYLTKEEKELANKNDYNLDFRSELIDWPNVPIMIGDNISVSDFMNKDDESEHDALIFKACQDSDKVTMLYWVKKENQIYLEVYCNLE